MSNQVMKGSAVILFMIITSCCFAQVAELKFPGKENSTRVSDLIPVDPVQWQDVIGEYSGPINFDESIISGLWIVSLDSNFTFKSVEYSCFGGPKPGTGGSWSIKNNKLEFTFPKRMFSFDILKFDNFYFFISPAQHESFIRDLRQLKETAFMSKAGSLNDNLIGYCLGTRYVSKEIKLNPGEAAMPPINRN